MPPCRCGSAATVEKVTDLKEMMALGVMSTPAVVIDNNVMCTGRAFQVRSHGLDRYAGRSCFRSFDFHRLPLRRQVLTVNGAVYPPAALYWRSI